MPEQIFANLRHFFETGKTKSYAFRYQQLEALSQFVNDYEQKIEKALYDDLRKPPLEAFAMETAVMASEIKFAKRHLASWMKPISTKVIFPLQPAKSYRVPEPLGVVLIMGPWNYPIQLTLSPLIGAIAAGNCAVIKPSEFTPHASRLLAEALPHYLPECVSVVEGNHEVASKLSSLPFDHIFFTGSTQTGKLVMRAAADHLTPVTLELGGKSPCIVLKDANLKVAARRIAWGKFINAGQTCIAPDYILADKTILPALINELQKNICDFYGNDPETSKDYGRIINARHVQRLAALLQDAGSIVAGGQINENDLYIAPTIISPVNVNSAIMQEEIFGPLLPIIAVQSEEEIVKFINQKPKPLALYLFTRNNNSKQYIIQNVSAGSMCINHTLLQCGNPYLPFGGVGASGMGTYHGKETFATFSHYKSVFDKPYWPDFSLQYPPYTETLRKILRWFT